MPAWKKILLITLTSILLAGCFHDPVGSSPVVISREVNLSQKENVQEYEKYKWIIQSLESKMSANNIGEETESEKRWNEPIITTVFPNATVTYTRPVFPFWTDKFDVIVQDKKYTFSGVYNQEEKKKYLAKLDKGMWILYTPQEYPWLNEDKEIHLYKNKKYVNPNYINGMWEIAVYTVDGFMQYVSPRSVYLFYRVLVGWEMDKIEIIEISTGKKIINKIPGPLQQIEWINNNQRMLFIWGYRQPALLVTKQWLFPEYHQISWPEDSIIAFHIDENYLAALANDHEDVDGVRSRDLIIYDRKTLKEIERNSFIVQR